MIDWLSKEKTSKRRLAYHLMSRLASSTASIDDLPDWSYRDSRKRDAWMLSNWQTVEHLMAGAMNRMIESLATRGWALVGPKRQVRHYREVLINFQGLNKGSDSWNSGTAKQMAIHYLASDLGPKYIGFHDSANKLVGIALLDPSLLKYTTHDNKANWYYYHPAKSGAIALDGEKFTAQLDGKKKQVTGRVSGFVSVPPSRTKHDEVGRCAFSLILGFAKLIAYLFEHWKKSLDESPTPGVTIWRGMSQEELMFAAQDFFSRLKEKRKKEGRIKTPSFPVFDEEIRGIDMVVKRFSEAPESLDPEKLIDLYFWYMAACLDVNESFIRTVNTGSFGNAAQVTIQQEVTERTGERAMISQFVESVSRNFLPDTIEMTPDDSSALAKTAKLESAKLFMDVHERMISSQIITPYEARVLAVKNGLLPADFISEDQDVSETDSQAVRNRDEHLSSAVIRAIEEFPDEPLIESRFNPKLGRPTEKVISFNPTMLLKPRSYQSSSVV